MEHLKKSHKIYPCDHPNCPALEELEQLKEECKHLRELARIDLLTGFYNFRFLMSSLEKEMERTRRTGLHTSLIMIDLDNFKRINDVYDHESGNKTLKWISTNWRNSIRTIDIPCRYGGEEFVIILPNTNLSQAVHTAERLRCVTENKVMELNNEKLVLTASFGVDHYTGKRNLSAETFVKNADGFLMQAKQNGRNRVCYDEAGFLRTGMTGEERKALLKP